VFKTTCVVPQLVERAVSDPPSVHLFYIQAVHHVIHSLYPCPSADIAIQLGGMQLQVLLGDYKSEAHDAHIRDNLNSYIPDHLKSKLSRDAWHLNLIAQHTSNVGLNPEALKQRYLDLVRQWDCYGSTFYKAQYKEGITTFFSQDFEGEVLLGVNESGIHIVEPNEMKMATFGLRQIRCWYSDKKNFVLEGRSTNPKQRGAVVNFKTRQAELIEDLVYDWAMEWMKQFIDFDDKRVSKKMKERKRKQTK